MYTNDPNEIYFRIEIVIEQSTVDDFIDQWIEKVESLNLFFGGCYDPDTGKLGGVVELDNLEPAEIEEKTQCLKTWLESNPYQITICKIVTLEELLKE